MAPSILEGTIFYFISNFGRSQISPKRSILLKIRPGRPMSEIPPNFPKWENLSQMGRILSQSIILGRQQKLDF